MFAEVMLNELSLSCSSVNEHECQSIKTNDDIMYATLNYFFYTGDDSCMLGKNILSGNEFQANNHI